jgi:serine protease
MGRGVPRPQGRAAVAGFVALLAAGIWSPAADASGVGNGHVPIPEEPARPERTGRAIVLVEPPEEAPAAGVVAQTARVRERIRTVLDRTELSPELSIPEARAVAVEPPGDGGVAAVRRALRGEPGVVAVEPEYRRSLRLIPNDPAFATSDPLAPRGDTFQWQLRDGGFERAWDESLGQGAAVAVVDTGVDADNPDLGPRIVATADHDTTPGHGPATVDEIGHGTHVSGLACATGNNAYGGASSSFGCGLIVAKTDLTDASIARSIVDAADNGADVINMSLGGPGASRVIENAVDHAWKRDVVMVAAASNVNQTNQGVPARLLQPEGTGPKLKRGRGLVVTAAEYDGSRAFFGPGHGKGISLAAYGAASASMSTPGIFSNFPANPTELEVGTFREPPCECRTTFGGDDRFAYLEGTSMAAPQVAGAAALIRSRRPGIDAKRVVKVIKKTASGRRFKGSLGWGILNARAAVRVAVGAR